VGEGPNSIRERKNCAGSAVRRRRKRTFPQPTRGLILPRVSNRNTPRRAVPFPQCRRPSDTDPPRSGRPASLGHSTNDRV